MKDNIRTQLVFIRIVIPATLLIGCLLRINFLSFSYGLLLLAAPFLPSPKPEGTASSNTLVAARMHASGWTRRYIQSIMVTCLSITVAQLVYHVILLADPPYGHDFTDCEFFEKLARQFGFQRLDLATGWQLTRLISPDILVTFVAIYAYIECIQEPAAESNRQQGRTVSSFLMEAMAQSPITAVTEEAVNKAQDDTATEGDKWRAWLFKRRIQAYIQMANDVLLTALLALAGIMHPCLFSAPYFAVFLFLATYWASNHTLDASHWLKIRKGMVVYSGIHLVLQYLYQFEFFQESLLPESFSARLLGFTVVVKAQCEDVRSMQFDETQFWPIFINPLVLMSLYGVVAVQLRIYFEHCDQEIISETEERVPKGTTVRAGLVTRQRSIRYGPVTTSPYLMEKLLPPTQEEQEVDIPLNLECEDADRKDSLSVPPPEPCGPRRPTLTRIEEKPPSPAHHADKRKSIFTRVPSVQLDKGAIATVIQFVTQQSYVMQLFMMMGWSISYHSWSTFVLLLIACAVWMVPDSRKFCLKLSPFVAIYAEILLVLQYIYGLNLTQEELPDENPRVLRQLGLEKPRGDPPCVPLMTKTMFTIMFWVTLRQHLQESAALRRDRLGQGLVNSPFNVAFAPTHSGIKKPKRDSILSLGSPKSSRSHSPLPASAALKVQQFGAWLRKLIAKYWVLINCGLLLFISLRTPVVAYRIIYAFFFLIFVNCFQISFRVWRRLLYPFWMTMITYCMAVLTLIYTYQFHGFPEMWQNGTGLSYDVLESIGLEQFSSGELLLKLLTPISFLIFTIVQVNFFHKDLMERTLRLQNVLYPPVGESRSSLFIASIRRRTLRRSKKSSSSAGVCSIFFDYSVHQINDPVTSGKRGSKSSKLSCTSKLEENQHLDQDQMQKDELLPKEPEAKISSSSPQETTDDDEELQTEAHAKPARKVSASLKELVKEKSKRQAQRWFHIVETKWKELVKHQDRIANLAWRIMEIHIGKCVALLMMGICVSEVSAANIPYTVFIAIMLPMERFVPIVSHIAGVWTSFIIVVKMLYQMKFVKQQEVFINCSDTPGINGTVYSSVYPFHGNVTVDPAAWAGFHKTEEVSNYFKGYLCLIVLMAFHSVVNMRQKLYRKKMKLTEPLRGVLLPDATRETADDGIPSCIKYFINFFFYKFGLEICFLTTVATVGIRSDFVSILYSLSLIGLLMIRRTQAARIWPFYVMFLAITFPFQYLLCVGIPPSLCSSYPWSTFDSKLVEWLHLPDFATPPDPIKLVGDFFQLLFACCQMYVFRIETSSTAHDYVGGDNTELVYEEQDKSKKLLDEAQISISTPDDKCGTESIPVPDFISYSKSYLDLVKFLLFVYLYWATLAIVFVAGVSRVTLFAMGYVVGCFMFLWVGNELFLKPLPFAVKLWNLLIGYNVVIIFLKTSLQVVGCVYIDQMYRNYCWVIQLFGIACLKTGITREADFDPTILNECNVPLAEAGILFDGICFFFLLLQRRIVCSHYFKHVIAEFKAQQVFASRGFELISQITMKEIEEQRAKESEIVLKIKKKMDKIKQSQKGGQKGRRMTKQKSQLEASNQSLSSLKRQSSPQIPIGVLSDHSSFSLPIEAFDDPSVVATFREALAASPSDQKLLSTPGGSKFIVSPSTVRTMGVPRSIAEMQAQGQQVPVVGLEEIAPQRDPTPTSAPCHFVGPHVLPSPDSQNYIPYLSSPTEQGSMYYVPHGAAGAQPPTSKYQKHHRGSFVPQRHKLRIPKKLDLPLAMPHSETHPQPKLRKKHRTPSVESADSSSHSGDDWAMDDESDDNDDSEIMELDDRNQESVVPETDADRRKGLGPLQLLNVAFKKGAMKEAVKESTEMAQQQEEMEKQMEGAVGHADSKAIRRHLKRQKSRKIRHGDFEEDTFEEDHISTDIVGTNYEQKYEVQRRARLHRLSRTESEDLDTEMIIGEDLPPPYSEVQDRRGSRSPFMATPIAESPEHFIDGEANADFPYADGPKAVSDEEESEELDSKDELANDGLLYKLKTLYSMIHDYIRNAILFVKLFGTGVIETTITWLLKLSRDFRYVSHVLVSEKRYHKEMMTMSPEEQKAVRHIKPLNRTPSGFPKDESMMKLHMFLQKQQGFEPSAPTDEEQRKFDKEKNMFVRLFVASYYLLISRSEMFCYLMMVLNHMSSASFLTMPIPLMAFLWGTLSLPRPSKLFWITVITYTEAMVVIKYLFQFGFFPWNKSAAPPDVFWAPRILGIEKQDKYAAWDLALLMVLFFHRSILKTLGLWKEDVPREENNNQEAATTREDSIPRRMSSLSKKSYCGSAKKEEPIPEQCEDVSDQLSADIAEKLDSKFGSLISEDASVALDKADDEETEEDDRKTKLRKGLSAYVKQVIQFFRLLLNPADRYSVDLYAPMFLCDFICFVIVIMGFSAFGTDTGAGGVASYFEENKIPGAFLVMLIVQFALIIIDRALFLRKFLFGKLVYQLCLAVFVHIWMFFILPGVTDRLFVKNTPAKLWYFTKCIYFCLSAWQIRSGYPTRILGNILTKKYTIINWVLFKGFMTIPFLFEIRAFMDWIWTDTSMGIGDWLKMEDIYANVYQIKCERQLEEDYPSPRGVKKRPLLKYGLGGALLVGIILIIWFPLVLFSLANTVGLQNLPVDCTVKLTIGGYQPIFQMSAQQQALQVMSEENFDQLHYKFRYHKMAVSYMSDYSASDVMEAHLNGNSTSIWGISPPSKNQLIQELNGTGKVVLKFEWHFTRMTIGALLGGHSEDFNQIVLEPGDQIRKGIIQLLLGKSRKPVRINKVFPPYVKVPGTPGRAKEIYALLVNPFKPETPLNQSYTDVTLQLESGRFRRLPGHVEWWQMNMIQKERNKNPKTRKDQPWLERTLDKLILVAFVDKVFPSTFSFIAGGGILGLYTTLVLVVGRFIRMLVTGAMFRIMYEELPNVDRILQLCLDIFLVREAGELMLEEDLYSKLIFLYRSPALLIKWSKVKNK